MATETIKDAGEIQKIGVTSKTNEKDIADRDYNIQIGGVWLYLSHTNKNVEIAMFEIGDFVDYEYHKGMFPDGKPSFTLHRMSHTSEGSVKPPVEEPHGQQELGTTTSEVNQGKPPEKDMPMAVHGEQTSTALTSSGPSKDVSLFALDKASRTQLIQNASDVAGDLKQIIEKQKLYTVMGGEGRKYVHVEGWQVLAALLGCTSEVTMTNETPKGYIAKAVIYNSSGRVLGSGEMQVDLDETIKKRDGTVIKRWNDNFQARSMAQTRAIGKAYRNTLSWIMTLGGYEPTPAEELKDWGE